jgi:hypothetical protein
MPLHPTAEAYRVAMANGDHTTAASLLVQAHSGDYNSMLIDQIHEVGRMTRAQLTADPAPVPARTVGVVNNVYVNGSGS